MAIPSIQSATYQGVQTFIDRSDYSSAVINFLGLLTRKDQSDFEETYSYLERLVPSMNEKNYVQLLQNLPNLLYGTSQHIEEQQKLALTLADWNRTHAYNLPQTMNFYAKTIQLSAKRGQDPQSSHILATQLLLSYQIDYRVARYQQQIEEAFSNRDTQKFQELLDLLKEWKTFCTSPEETKIIERLHLDIMESYNAKIPVKQNLFSHFVSQINQGMHEPPKPHPPITQTYHQALANYRAQAPSSQSFDRLIAHFLSHAIILLGPPPCPFDLRAMGSAGRDELCPYSDLEPFIVVETLTPEVKTYFTHLLTLLDLQLRSLGESADIPIAFTALGPTNPSGLHFDKGLDFQDLIHTPTTLNAIQPQIVNVDPSTFAHTALKSRSIQTPHTTPIACTPPCSQQHARAYVEHRIKTNKPQPLTYPTNLKTAVIEPLFHLLSDLSLLYNISDANTCQIVDQLVAHNHFTPESGAFLRETLEALYQLRLKLHTHYHEQKEEIASDPSLTTYTLTTTEKELLFKTHHLILTHLYRNPTTRPIDLFQLTLEQLLQTPDPILTEHLALTVEKFNPSLHTSIFSKLDGSLRLIYYKTIPHPDPALAQIPTRSGTRIAFTQEATNLQTTLHSITTATPPTQGPVVKITTSTTTRYLTPEAARAILDSHNNIQKQYPKSAHHVASYQGLHFKQTPIHPMMEYAIHNLAYRLFGKLTPPTELVRFHIGTHMYPVLISQTQTGQTLKENPNPHFTPLGWKQFTWHILLALLTKPGDGLPSNYLHTPDTLLCIDNDISFVEPVTDKKNVHFCSALFTLFPDKPLDPDVLKTFYTLDADAFLDDWMSDLIAQEKTYSSLFTLDEQKSLYNKDPNNRFKATLLFKKGTVATLNLQFVRLQNTLRELLTKNTAPTSQQLLKTIISLQDSPTVTTTAGDLIAHTYEKAQKLPTIDDKLKEITKRHSAESLSSLRSDQITYGKIPTWKEIEALEEYTLPKAQEELLSTLLKRTASYLTIVEKQNQRGLHVSFKNIVKDELTQEPDIERQRLILKALGFFVTQDPPHYLTITECEALTLETLKPLLHPELERLDISGSPNLKHLSDRGVLRTDALKFPNLRELVCNRCASLQTIEVEAPELRRLEAKKNEKLTSVKLKALVCTTDITGSSQVKLQHEAFFGAAAWKEYIGDVGVEPALPRDIVQILESPCPYWPGKKVKETHLLTLIPERVNGDHLTLKLLGELVQKPLKGNSTKYNAFDLGEYADPGAPKSHWALMTKDVIQGSRAKDYSEQQKLIKQPYEVPTVLDAAVTIMMEYMKTGKRLYSNSPWTGTLCQEKYDQDWQLVVGGFSSGGLGINRDRTYFSVDGELYGVGGCRTKF